jgi:hypothetical protein
MKKGDFVFVKLHNKREDVICRIKKPTILGGEFYRFVHYINADTVFVARSHDCGSKYDGKDKILVPEKALDFSVKKVDN